MRLILLLLFVMSPVISAEPVVEKKVEVDFVKANIHIFPIKDYRVIDGDTVEVFLDLQFGLTMKTSIRIIGINTPEVRGDREKKAGLAIKEVVEQWMKERGPLYCQVVKEDKFGGRFDGRIISATDYRLSEYLLDNNLAQEYDGKTKKVEFTQKELDDMENAAYNLIIEKLEEK